MPNFPAFVSRIFITISSLLYWVFKPIVFRIDPERTHNAAVRALNSPISWPVKHRPLDRPIEFAGMSLPNRLGLAAGFFKDPATLVGITRTGFGFVEVGSITLLPQAGNPQPRLFRFPEQELLVNRFGFNNPGALASAATLAMLQEQNRIDRPIWINIGKSKLSDSVDESIADIAATYQALESFGQATVVNLASPNTPGLRKLLGPEFMQRVLEAINAENRTKPLMIKVHPDMETAEWSALVNWLKGAPIDGVVCANTTVSRVGDFAAGESESGGASGKALIGRTLPLVRALREELPQSIGIVACGGIHDIDSAQAYLDAGADLLEMYTGWIFGGPGTEDRIIRKLPL